MLVGAAMILLVSFSESWLFVPPPSPAIRLVSNRSASKGWTTTTSHRAASSNTNDETANSSSDAAVSAAAPVIRLNDLLEMDVVVFSETTSGDSNNNNNKRQLGAVQEDGRVTPLCVWTAEPAFGTALEFLVDEEDLLPGFASDDAIRIHAIVPQDKLSYGSRQVGGGMGPGNPHGEESELLYYIDQSVVDDENVEVVVKPELEIFW